MRAPVRSWTSEQRRSGVGADWFSVEPGAPRWQSSAEGAEKTNRHHWKCRGNDVRAPVCVRGGVEVSERCWCAAAAALAREPLTTAGGEWAI